MFIYVLNDPEFIIPPKSKKYNPGRPHCYPDDTRWLWGAIYTNQADRTSERYAFLFSPDGTTKHCFSKITFNLFEQCETKVIDKPCQAIWSPPTPMEFYGRSAAGINACRELGACCCPFITKEEI